MGGLEKLPRIRQLLLIGPICLLASCGSVSDLISTSAAEPEDRQAIAVVPLSIEFVDQDQMESILGWETRESIDVACVEQAPCFSTSFTSSAGTTERFIAQVMVGGEVSPLGPAVGPVQSASASEVRVVLTRTRTTDNSRQEYDLLLNSAADLMWDGCPNPDGDYTLHSGFEYRAHVSEDLTARISCEQFSIE